MKKSLKGIIETLIFAVCICSSIGFVYASEIGDENGGPGINLTTKDYDNANGYIYSYGVGPVVEETTTSAADLHYQQPTTVESSIVNPIDNSTIDMGPTSATNANYSLHYINDGGPGMGVESNALGSTVRYNDGGPGMEVSAQTNTEETYVDNGPTTVESTADPRNFLEMIADFISSKGEGIYRSYKKNTTNNTTK